MASVDEILALLAIIYSDIIEPIFCILYAYILIRIVTAKSLNFRSEFYAFSIATGIVAIANVMFAWALRMTDNRFQFFPNRGVFLNLMNMFSHMCGIAITMGKTLSVATRFTAICMVHRKNMWDGRVIPICLLGMFGVPILLNCYFPAFPAVFGPTPDGYGYYKGIANPGQIIAKAVATSGYLFFFLTAIPMSCMSVFYLRRNRLKRSLIKADIQNGTDTNRQETMLTIWFIALVGDMKELLLFAMSQYIVPNTLGTFTEPVLLLISSPNLRKEVFFWRKRGGPKISTTTASMLISSHHSTINK